MVKRRCKFCGKEYDFKFLFLNKEEDATICSDCVTDCIYKMIDILKTRGEQSSDNDKPIIIKCE